MAPIIGELAFILGITQPKTVKTQPDGDVQLLVLSKDDSYSLFDSYPEQVTIALLQALPCSSSALINCQNGTCRWKLFVKIF